MSQFITRLPRALGLSTAIGLIVSACATPVLAQTWIGAVSNNWLDSQNWTTGTLPSNLNTFVTGPVVNMPTIDGGTASTGLLFVGYDAATGGASLTLDNAAALTSANAIIGDSTNGSPALTQYQRGIVTLKNGSSWNAGGLTVGFYGDGVIDILSGSKVTADSITLGTQRGPTAPEYASGTLTISGANSNMTVTGSAHFGDNGSGTALIENRGTLVTGSGALGVNAESVGKVTVTGAGSSWTTAGNSTFNIGNRGTGTLEILSGASFSSGAGTINVGTAATGQGTVTVDGPDSSLKGGAVYLGNTGSGTATFKAGAEGDLSSFFVGVYAGGIGNLNVTGSGTHVKSTASSIAGFLGTGTVTISDGGVFEAPLLQLGSQATGQGTLNIGSAATDAATGAGILDVGTLSFGLGSGTLVFNHTSANLDFDPILTQANGANGPRTIRHLAGVTNLSADSLGFNGNTYIDGGTINVIGALGGVINVNSGGTIGGHGTIGTTKINSGGVLAPEGTLTVNGNLTLHSASTYRVDAGISGNDQVTVTGTANLGGTVKVSPTGLNGWTDSRRILAANALTGTFANISSNSAFIDAKLNYTNVDEVWIDLQRNGVKFDDVANTGNQTGVGKVLTNLPMDNPLVVALSSLNAEEARDAMDQLAGDTLPTVSAVGTQVAGQVQGVAMNRIRQSFSALGSGNNSVSSYWPGGYDGGEPLQSTAWIQGLGEYTHVRPSAAASGLDALTGGVLTGADILLDDWRVGAIAGYTQTGFTSIGNSTTGNVQNLHAGVYAGAELDAWRLQFNALQTWHGISSNRNVSFGGLNETLTANYGAQTSLVYGEVGYAFDLDNVALEPFASASYAVTNTDAFSETGGLSALSSAATRNDAITTVIGLRSSTSIALDDKLVTLSGMVGWQHQSGKAPSNQVTLAGSTPFTVTGADSADNAFVYEAGLNLDISERFNADLVYGGRLSQSDLSHSIKAILAASF